MAMYITQNKFKLMCGGSKVRKIMCQNKAIYSSGSIVTYIVDSVTYHTQEYEEGQSVLSPSKTPSKSGYSFVGWSTSASGDVLSSLTMGETPITLYARFVQAAAWNFRYTGGVQRWTAPVTGLYLLTCYGAAGGNGIKSGSSVATAGLGGFTDYYAVLNKGDIIYLVCGGSGIKANYNGAPGGYNGGGGGNSSYNGNKNCGGTGGGATHIATVSGLLINLSSKKSSILAVAGGGGGGGNAYAGGSGGGYNGNSASPSPGGGGTQSNVGTHLSWDTSTAGGEGTPPGFGKGGAQNTPYSGAGGGGFYGGGAGGDNCGGGGGSGYIKSATTIFKGKTYTNTTSQGGNNGNGSASIQFISA